MTVIAVCLLLAGCRCPQTATTTHSGEEVRTVYVTATDTVTVEREHTVWLSVHDTVTDTVREVVRETVRERSRVDEQRTDTVTTTDTVFVTAESGTTEQRDGGKWYKWPLCITLCLAGGVLVFFLARFFEKIFEKIA